MLLPLCAQETSWSMPEGVKETAEALKLTPEKAAILAMLKANNVNTANLRPDLRGACC